MLHLRSRRRFAPITIAALVGALLSVAPIVSDTQPAEAADNGSVDVSLFGPPSILHGEDATYTLSATHNGGGPDGQWCADGPSKDEPTQERENGSAG